MWRYVPSQAQLVIDALTVVRAYVAAGRPGLLTLPAFGSFDS